MSGNFWVSGIYLVFGLRVHDIYGVRNFFGWSEIFVSGIFWVVGNYLGVRIFLGGRCPDACACVHVAGVMVREGLKGEGWERLQG